MLIFFFYFFAVSFSAAASWMNIETLLRMLILFFFCLGSFNICSNSFSLTVSVGCLSSAASSATHNFSSPGLSGRNIPIPQSSEILS
jgi:hypothetical protein